MTAKWYEDYLPHDGPVTAFGEPVFYGPVQICYDEVSPLTKTQIDQIATRLKAIKQAEENNGAYGQ